MLDCWLAARLSSYVLRGQHQDFKSVPRLKHRILAAFRSPLGRSLRLARLFIHREVLRVLLEGLPRESAVLHFWLASRFDVDKRRSVLSCERQLAARQVRQDVFAGRVHFINCLLARVYFWTPVLDLHFEVNADVICVREKLSLSFGVSLTSVFFGALNGVFGSPRSEFLL